MRIPGPGEPASATMATVEAKRGLLDLPDEVLARIFTLLDRQTLSRCYRVSRALLTLALQGGDLNRFWADPLDRSAGTSIASCPRTRPSPYTIH